MNDSNSSQFWTKDLFKSQQTFMEALNAFSGSSNTDSIQPWLEAMKFWWNTSAKEAPVQNNDLFLKSMEQVKNYYFIGDWMCSMLKDINQLGHAGEEWQKVLNDNFDKLKKEFEDHQKNVNKSIHSLIGDWNLLPLDTFNRAYSAASLLPGDILHEFKPTELQEVTDRFLSTPGLGYTREYQEQIQEGIRLLNQRQQVSQEYNTALSKVGLEALDNMREEILRIAEQGEKISSLRQIYDLWILCNEKAYAKYVFTKEYSELYGRMTNSHMAVKKHGGKIVDEMLAALNMPTRKGINTMQKKQRELIRRETIMDLKIKGLEKELNEIRKFISAGKMESKDIKSGKKGTITGKAAKNKVAIKKTSKKKTSKKKTSKKKTSKKKISKKKTARKPAAKKKASRTRTAKKKIGNVVIKL